MPNNCETNGIHRGGLQYKYKRNPLVITVDYVLLVMAAKTMPNSAFVQRGVVFRRAVLLDR